MPKENRYWQILLQSLQGWLTRIVRIVKMFRDRDKVNADVVNGH